MFDVSANFQQALHRTLILTATALLMMFAWAYLRIPSGDLLIAVFAFLSAVRISEFSSQEMRLQILLSMLSGTALLQYIVCSTHNVQLLNILLPAAASGIILRILPPGSAFPVLLTSFLAYSASPGAYAAAERIFDLLIAGLTAYLISFSASGKSRQTQETDPGKPLTRQEAFTISCTIFCAALLYRLFNMPQGIWIILTVIFIYMVQEPGEQSITLIRQRIFSVPAGLMLGGLYSCTALAFDHRFAYLMPLIGAIGFFMLYYRHDFFLFSLFFMFAFTVYADWMSGTLHEFHFWQLLVARSLATAVGAAVLLLVEKSVSNTPNKAVII